MADSRRVRRRYDDGGVFKYVMLLPAVLWVVAFTFFPLISVLNYSFANYVLGSGITAYVGFANYIAVLESSAFWYTILITAIYVVVAVPVEFAVGVLLAWLVNLRPPGTRVFRGILAAPLFTMGVAVGYLGVTLFTSEGGPIPILLGWFGIHVPWFSTGWGGLLAAIILDIWRWSSFIFLIASAAFAAIPAELYDSVLLDARSHWTVLRRLALPLAWPVLTVAILLRMIEALKAFGLPFALTSGGPGTSTQLFSTADYLTTIQFFDFGKGSAMGIIYLILVSVIITVFFRQMRRRIE